jgi:predicted nucleic acid-binding protein
MAGNVLVDSSYYIDRLRAGGDPLVELTERADDYDFVTCGVVVTEVLRGMKHKKAHQRMADFLGCMIFVPTLNHVWDRVHRLAWELDRKGVFMQITDLLIAVSALEADAAVLTLDSDFQRVPGLQTLRYLA